MSPWILPGLAGPHARGWLAFHWEKRLWVLENQPSEGRDHTLCELRWWRWTESHLRVTWPEAQKPCSSFPHQETPPIWEQSKSPYYAVKLWFALDQSGLRDQHQYSVLIRELKSMTFNLKLGKKSRGDLFTIPQGLYHGGLSTLSWGLCG